MTVTDEAINDNDVINWDEVDESDKYELLPEDDYLVQVEKIVVGNTGDGDVMFNMHLKVAAGKYMGRYVFDSISFGEKAKKRAKLVLKRFGLPMTGGLAVSAIPAILQDKLAWAEVEIIPDTWHGKDKTKNNVPFAGYRVATDDDINAAAMGMATGGGDAPAVDKKTADDDVPF